MGIPVLVIGKSGSGKSTSLRNFGADEIDFINVSKKPLPFKAKFSNTLLSDDYDMIKRSILNSSKDTIVIDDAGYLIVNMFMKGHSNAGGGNAVFGFYNKVGDNFWNLIELVKSLPENKIVYFIMHEDKNDFGDIKPKTIGKILDEKVCLEGMFTIVLRAIRDRQRHIFRTQSDGYDVSKSPMGMFLEWEIDNDLKYVDQKIREYWELYNKQPEPIQPPVTQVTQPPVQIEPVQATQPEQQPESSENINQDIQQTVLQQPAPEAKKEKKNKNKPEKQEKPVLLTEELPLELIELMSKNNITVTQIQAAVAHKGYYPIDTPIEKYDKEFIDGVLIGAWPQVLTIIKQLDKLPF